jgi:hypothetical protein
MTDRDKRNDSGPLVWGKNLLSHARSSIDRLVQRTPNRVQKTGLFLRELEALDLKEVTLRGKDDKEIVAKLIPRGYSPIRFAMSEVCNIEYKPIEDFEEALNTEDAVLVMEGDFGGQIYLTCPMKLVRCSEEALENLLTDLDDIAWHCNKGLGTGIYYEVRKPGDWISGGMGGGYVSDGLWVYPEFDDRENEIKDVIEGRSERIRKKPLSRMWSRFREFLVVTVYCFRSWKRRILM